MAAGRDALRDFQKRPRRLDVGTANGVAIHRAVVLRGHLQSREEVFGQNTSVTLEGGNLFHTGQRLGARQQQRQGFVKGQQRRSAHKNSGAE